MMPVATPLYPLIRGETGEYAAKLLVGAKSL